MSNPFIDQTPDNVRDMRASAGKTRAEAAAVIGVTTRAWKSWETAQRKVPKGTLERFAAGVWAQAEAAGEAQLAVERLTKRSDEIQASLVVAAHTQAARTGPPPLPPFTHVKHATTPEQDAASNADLASGEALTVADHDRDFGPQRKAMVDAASQRHHDSQERANKILMED
jgi:DNA-binding XRE family transcriptional regulator